MSGFAKGDYVKFVGMFGDGGFGRVASVGGNGLMFVCFTAGCTAETRYVSSPSSQVSGCSKPRSGTTDSMRAVPSTTRSAARPTARRKGASSHVQILRRRSPADHQER